MSSELLLMSGSATSYSLYGWGANGFNQFGYNSGSLTYQPLAALNASASIVQITSLGTAMLALDTVGQVWAWGNNNYGQVGNFTTNRTIVSPVIVLSSVVQVTAVGDLSAAVKSDGTVWVWGQLFGGLNGVGYATYSSPVQLTTISGVAQVELGQLLSNSAEFILYRKSNGEIWSQGNNSSGQLGDNTTTYRSSPVQVTVLTTDVTKVQAGRRNATSYALKSDGTVWAWGSNSTGSAGTGFTSNSPRQVQYYSPFPTLIGNLSNITNIFSGYYNCFAINSSGELWGWGSGEIYQLGDQNYIPLNTTRSYAVLINQFYDNNGNITSVPNITQVSAGPGSVQAIDAAGRLYSWGYNDVGQAGNSIVGALQSISKPTQIGTSTNWSKVASGWRDSGANARVNFQANYALTTSGAAYGTGVAYYYNFTRTNTVVSPTQVGANGDFLEVSFGGDFGIALGADRFLYTVGNNGLGQLGTTISYSGNEPSSSGYLSREKWWYEFLQIGTYRWKKVAAARLAGYAIRSDNTLWSWGYNSQGQLGDGTITTRSSPVQVISTSLSSPVLIAGGNNFCYAVDQNGLVWAWGTNGLGELGIGTYSPGDYRLSPLPVVDNSIYPFPQLSNITQISSGYGNGLALKSNGEIWAWGLNLYGVFGAGAGTVGFSWPYAIQSTLGLYILLNGSPIQIASGQYHSLALSSDGTVWACGYNDYGQVGDGTTISRPTAVQVSGISDIVAIGASLYSSYAIANDGKLWVWGQNTSNFPEVPDNYIGYLGTANNSVTAYSSPVLVGTYPGAEAFASSGSSSVGFQGMLVKPS